MDNMWAFLSLVLAVVYFFGRYQILNGKNSFLGENAEKSIKPEDKAAYCREMCVPIFLLGIVEAADGIMQFVMGPAMSGWSMLILGAGIMLAFVWMMAIQRRYARK